MVSYGADACPNLCRPGPRREWLSRCDDHLLDIPHKRSVRPHNTELTLVPSSDMIAASSSAQACAGIVRVSGDRERLAHCRGRGK